MLEFFIIFSIWVLTILEIVFVFSLMEQKSRRKTRHSKKFVFVVIPCVAILIPLICIGFCRLVDLWER